MNDPFFKKMKNKIEVSPSKDIDLKILKMMEQKTSQKMIIPHFSRKVYYSLCASLILMITLFYIQKPSHDILLTDKIELIEFHDEIELWAESSSWTDEEWNEILDGTGA
jgi:hypothetical protein